MGDVRARWSIEAPTQLPRDISFLAVFDPPTLRGVEEPDFENDYEAWASHFQTRHKWHEEVRMLYDQAIPEDCRVSDNFFWPPAWARFLSACVLFEPPVPGLVEFRESFDFGVLGGPESPAGGSPYGMVAPPIVQMRDAQEAVDTTEEYYLHIIEYLVERYSEVQGLDPREVLADAFAHAPVRKAPLGPEEILEEVASLRWFIEVKPYHTEQDVRNAFLMVTAAHAERPKQGRPKRDTLVAAECATLKERGWSNRQLADRYGWQDENIATKYAATGRGILKETSQN